MSRIIPQTNLSAITKQLTGFENYALDVRQARPLRHSSCYDAYHPNYNPCQYAQSDLKELLINAAKAATLVQQGLCLKCVRQGKVSKDEGNCWAKTELMHATGMDYAGYEFEE